MEKVMSQPVVEDQSSSDCSGKKYISPEAAQLLIDDITQFRNRVADSEEKLELSEAEGSELA